MAKTPKNVEAQTNTQWKTIVSVLVALALLYLTGLTIVFFRFGDVDIPDFWSVFFTADAEETIAGGDTAMQGPEAADDEADRTRSDIEKKKRFLREEPVNDNLPEMPLFDTEGKKTTGDRETVVESAPPEVLPGPLPKGVFFKEGLRRLKCWDKKGFEISGQQCDRLSAFETLIRDRLYLADQCRKEILGPLHTGALAVAMELDFVRNTVSIWEGAGSSLHRSSQVATCFKESLGDIRIARYPHKHSRYHVQADITFGRPTRVLVPGTTVAAPLTPTGDPDKDAIKKAMAEAKEAEVIKTRVRVRKAPVDGEIIGFVSTPQKVRLIEQKGDWCLVKTKRDNLGWMICSALVVK